MYEISIKAHPNKVKYTKQNTQQPNVGLLGACKHKSLTMTYFHTGIRTIIGAKSFHGPVRDGKGWYQLAMVIRHNFLINYSG